MPEPGTGDRFTLWLDVLIQYKYITISSKYTSRIDLSIVSLMSFTNQYWYFFHYACTSSSLALISPCICLQFIDSIEYFNCFRQCIHLYIYNEPLHANINVKRSNPELKLFQFRFRPFWLVLSIDENLFQFVQRV